MRSFSKVFNGISHIVATLYVTQACNLDIESFKDESPNLFEICVSILIFFEKRSEGNSSSGILEQNKAPISSSPYVLHHGEALALPKIFNYCTGIQVTCREELKQNLS